VQEVTQLMAVLVLLHVVVVPMISGVVANIIFLAAFAALYFN
jgi:hypothetical protein